MVAQTPQTRLLTNLLKSTKEYTTTLTSHLVVSHTSLSALQAYASASSPSTAQAILGVAEALKASDDAFARYANEVDTWRERLKEVKQAEEEVANILRDREILVTRLIKASSKKPTRDSVIHPPSPTTSQISIATGGGTAQQQKLSNAQVELQACEAHLATKQRELDQIRAIAIRDGLEQRCQALAKLGSALSEKGSSGVRALQDGYAIVPNGFPSEASELFRTLPQRPGSPSEVSLAPSQSASQSGANTNQSLPPLPTSYTPYRLSLPPPHAIGHDISDEGHNIPFSERILEEEEGESSGTDTGPVHVVENHQAGAKKGNGLLPGSDRKHSKSMFSSSGAAPRSSTPPSRLHYGFLPHRDHSSDVGPSSPTVTRSNLARRDSIRSVSTSGGNDDRKHRGGLFGAFTGLFKGKNKKDGPSSPLKKSFGGSTSKPGSEWNTRTERNIASVRSASREDDSSSDERESGGLVAISNRQPGILTIPPPDRITSRNGEIGGPRKLTRASSTSKVPSRSQSSSKKKRRSSSVTVDPVQANRTAHTSGEGSGSDLQRPRSLSRSGTVRSSMSEPPKSTRKRQISLPLTPSSPPPAVPPTKSDPSRAPVSASVSRNSSLRSDGRSPKPKALHLTPATEDPTAWLNHSPGSSSTKVISSSSTLHHSGSIRQGHARAGSRGDAKAVSLMTLVEGVSADRQRNETFSTVQRSATPKMMLPSEFMKTTTRVTAATTIPTVAIDPPTPGDAVEHEKQLNGSSLMVPGDDGHRSRSSHEADPPVKHIPPPRSASPLRSAMRARGATSPGSPSSTTSSSPAMASAPMPVVHAPVPIRPKAVKKESEDDLSSYETGHEDLSDNDDDDMDKCKEDDVSTPTGEKESPVLGSATLAQIQSQLSNTRPSAPQTNGQSPPSTELSGGTAEPLHDGLSNVGRRKSVRLDVPDSVSASPAPHVASFAHRQDLPPLPPKTNAGSGGWRSRIADDGAVPDVWADSSDEDEDYVRARKLLEKANKKEKSTRAADAAASAGRTPPSKKRHTIR